MSKEQAREEELRRQRELAAMPRHAPRLPALSPTPKLEEFGGDEDAKNDGTNLTRTMSPLSRKLAHLPIHPGQHHGDENVDPYARTESMTHRGRYSYASSLVSTVNGPRRLRRRKDPTPYNILIIGARNCGKTSFLNFLRASLSLPAHKHPTHSPHEIEEIVRQSPADDGFTSSYLETEIDGERIGLTLWDSQGFEKNIADLQLRGVTAFLESKFEETLTEEMKVIRSPGARDTHIHLTFLILDPVRLDANIAAAKRAATGTAVAADSSITGILDENLDIQVLRTMLGKTTIVPVISKADTVTAVHMAYLKKAVRDSLKKANIDPLEILTLEEQEELTSSESEVDNDEDENHKEADVEHGAESDQDAAPTNESQKNKPSNEEHRSPTSPSAQSHSTRRSESSLDLMATSLIPFSILSPDPHSLEAGDEPVGRRFPWGFADPYNPEHCDFVKLKDCVFGEWRSEVRGVSREVWYERWRTNRLNRNGDLTPEQKRHRKGPFTDGRRTR